MKSIAIFLPLFFLSWINPIHGQVSVSNLRCEMLKDPFGIDVSAPGLSWQIESKQRNVSQTHYQVFISSTVGKLQVNEGDIWNSGKVKSTRSLLVKYTGSPLRSATTYYWKVRVFTNKGDAVSGGTAVFSTGLLNPGDWKAKWIGRDKASPWDSVSQWSRLSARYLRKEFSSHSAVKRATVYISGLGMYELYLNGKKIGDQVLAPNPTDFRKSVFYNTHDVTGLIANGKNAIATVLGNGRFFTMRQNYKTYKHNNFGYPKLLLQLEIEYVNGNKKTIISDESWKLNADGPVRTNNEYDGEEYDANKEFKGWVSAGFNDSNWASSELVAPPAGTLVAQMAEPMKVMQLLRPASIRKMPDGKYILDMGQNFSGWIKLKNVNGKKGSRVVLRFGESLKPEGTLFTANLRDAKVTDVYTLKGTGKESWQPSFVYHGFRYLEISEFPAIPDLENFEGQLVYDALETTGFFETSDPTINKVYKNAWWGIASNYKGMPVDCPQRNERQPWLGDRTIGVLGESFVFGNAKLYSKWMNDIEQSQTPEGAIPDVAPAFWNYYSDNVTWPAAYITITNNLYNQFGDLRPIEQHYASMKKWMLYMKGKYLRDYILTKDKYGDWCVPPETLELIHARDSSRLTDGKLIATAYYFKMLGCMERFARLMSKHEDAASFSLLGDSIKVAFQKSFYHPREQYYSNNTVTANLLPLYFGICPDELKPVVFEKIVHKIHVDNQDHISTGLIGAQWLMRGLTEFGAPDLAFTLATNKTYPSWGYMAAQGATTIWELWNGNTADPGMNSQNHVMLLGDLLTWFYENLAGISSDKTDVAFGKIVMKPALPRGLDFVNSSYKSARGPIKSSWKKKDGSFEWNIAIPPNSRATIYIPASNISSIRESGKMLKSQEGIRVLKMENGRAVVEIGSGTYSFTSTI